MSEEVRATPTESDIRFNVPLYTVAEAARALGVPAPTLTTWARGYERRTAGRRPVGGAAVVTAFPAAPGRPAVPFIGLAEGLVLAAVRKSGVPMQRIRPALARLAKEIGVEHALASKKLYTDGADILFDYSRRTKTADAEVINDLVVVRNQQRVFRDVVKDFLQRITYGPDEYAAKIRLPGYRHADVVADPTRSFGQPIFTHGAARVTDVLERFWAGEDMETLSEEFGVPATEVEDVLRAYRPAA